MNTINNRTVITQKLKLRLSLALIFSILLSTNNLFAQGNPTTNNIDDIPPPPPAWTHLKYPASSLLKGVTFDQSSHRTEAHGSDIWPITWADDGHQYSAFGDGGGFGGSNNEGRVSMGVTRIEGTFNDYTGTNVWGGFEAENTAQFTGKGTGIICIDGVLYMWVCGKDSKVVSNVQLAISKDHSKSWTLMDWNWDMRDGLSAGVFVNSGRDYSDAPDDFVYAFFTHVNKPPEKPRGWIHERPGLVDLARCSRENMETKSAWEWFAGLDANGAPMWSSMLKERKPVFEDPNGIKVVSSCYQPSLDRYLLVYTPRNTGGNFALFESPNPWGPWSEVSYLKEIELFQPPKPNARVSIYHFAPKWWSSDGRDFTLVYNVGDDAWNTIRGTLMMK